MFWNLLKRKQDEPIIEAVNDNEPEKKLIKPTPVFLHGVQCTHRTFAFMESQFSEKAVIPSYDSYKPFFQVLPQLKSQLKDLGPIFIVGHSLGGMYALHLANCLPNIVAGVTMSAPYGGSRLADWAKYMLPEFQLAKDMGSRAAPITKGAEIQLDIPWLQIVSTSGQVPYMRSQNDGVITVESQRARPGIDYIELDVNHYEIVNSYRALEAIERRYAYAVDLLNNKHKIY